jgi:hypothetical protein
MSAAEKAAEVATDVMADAADLISEEAADFAEFARQLSKVKVQFSLLGFAIGTAAGAVAGFYIAYRKAETKYSKIADDEIVVMREHYQMKARAAEGTAQKSALSALVEDRGYSSPSENPPMAVQPPDKVIISEDERAGEPTDDDSAMAEDEVEGPNGVKPQEPEVRNIFRERDARVIEHEWDYHEEKKHRSPDVPYVIHYDERHEMDYQEVTLTYYSGDDVLCDERDSVMDEAERERLVGEKNLGRFGHGSNDPSIVYVRNDDLELVYEVVLSPNSYAEEVHGFSHEGYDRGNLKRMRVRERNGQEE